MHYLTLAEAAQIAPGRPSANAVWRWCRQGVRARNGDNVRLRHIRAGRKIFTSQKWLDEFFVRQTIADLERWDRLIPIPLLPYQERGQLQARRLSAQEFLRKEGFFEAKG
ncbi:MAG: DUF1580 domain-containing protein [Sedimentisphaerales bacterium]|nr:DUF1580 domain-containing protein [Sedimentisphaerales bacterium]